jgi:hypothetical protein
MSLQTIFGTLSFTDGTGHQGGTQRI